VNACPVGVGEAADHAGVTYRQADYWIRVGYLQSVTAGGEPFEAVPWSPTRRRDHPGGSGISRFLTDTELTVLTRMGRLVKTGLAVNVAAQAARFMTDRELAYAPLAGGVVIWIREGP
jgi:hypothetical protein